MLLEDEIGKLNKKVITIQKKMHGRLQKYEDINVDMVILIEIAEEAKDKDFEKLSLEDMDNEEVLSTSAIEECKLFIEVRVNNDTLIKKFIRLDKEEFFQLGSTCKKASLFCECSVH